MGSVIYHRLIPTQQKEKEMTTTAPAMPDFRQGADAAKEASKSANFSRTEWWGIKDGEEDILRFLTEWTPDPQFNPNGLQAWIVVLQHNSIRTKGAPTGHTGNWPERMGAVCRMDEAFTKANIFSDCYIDDHIVGKNGVKKPGARNWALACRREEVIGDGSPELGGEEKKGQVLGYRDKTREVTIPAKDGQPEKTVVEKDIVVVNMGYKNFFSILEGFGRRYGTVVDRDYWIKRSGSDMNDTTYNIVPIDPVPHSDGTNLDLRKPEHMKRYESEIDLATIVFERASDEFYARFFDPRYTVDKDGKVVPAGEGAAQAPDAPSADVDPAKLAAVRDRVRGYGSDGQQQAEEGGQPPAEQPQQPAAEQPPAEDKQPAAATGMRNFD